ncbi:MAG: hypothetical protein KGJ90_01915 [Patescibacteria group bacterium]|nr:hypothetical protein [Patescibacteria group bacterium]
MAGSGIGQLAGGTAGGSQGQALGGGLGGLAGGLWGAGGMPGMSSLASLFGMGGAKAPLTESSIPGGTTPWTGFEAASSGDAASSGGGGSSSLLPTTLPVLGQLAQLPEQQAMMAQQQQSGQQQQRPPVVSPPYSPMGGKPIVPSRMPGNIPLMPQMGGMGTNMALVNYLRSQGILG